MGAEAVSELTTRDAALIRNWLLEWIKRTCSEPNQTAAGVAVTGFAFGVNAALAHPDLAKTMLSSVYLLDLPTADRDAPLQSLWRAEQALAELNEVLHDPAS